MHSFRYLHTSARRLNITTAVFPGQGNVNRHIFQLTQNEIAKSNEFSKQYTDFINYSQSIVPNVAIAKYFNFRSYPDESTLKMELAQTSFVQPLVLLATYMNYKIIKDTHNWDVVNNTNYMLGHSLGELSTLVVQGVMSLEDGLRAAHQRGLLMEKTLEVHKMQNRGVQHWGMVALMFRERDFISILKVCQEDVGLNVANINGYEQIVVSGEVGEMKIKLQKLDTIQKDMVKMKIWKSKIRKVWLQTEIPAHNPILADMETELHGIIKLQSETLRVPVVCNLNGLVVTKNAQRVVDNFVKVTSKPVQFTKCLEEIIAAHQGTDKFRFVNVSDVTYGLLKRFFKTSENCEVYDLIDDSSKPV
jgi:[acyl-carrier-protein] S-malonyltransferase